MVYLRYISYDRINWVDSNCYGDIIFYTKRHIEIKNY